FGRDGGHVHHPRRRAVCGPLRPRSDAVLQGDGLQFRPAPPPRALPDDRGPHGGYPARIDLGATLWVMSDFKAAYGAQTGIRAKLDEFPIRVEFSLEPLIRYWETDLAVDDCLLGSAARIVLDRVAKVPALRGQATLDIVRENQDLIDALMIAVFSPTFQE